MRFSIRFLLALLGCFASLLAGGMWYLSLPANETWSYGNVVRPINGGVSPQFFFEIYGVDSKTPTVGYLIRIDDVGRTPAVPRITEGRLKGVPTDVRRSDFLLFVGADYQSLTPVHIDMDTAVAWFGSERINGHAQFLKFWDGFIQPKLDQAGDEP